MPEDSSEGSLRMEAKRESVTLHDMLWSNPAGFGLNNWRHPSLV